MYLYSQKSKDAEKGKRVGYWRKANAIHRWFVSNIQNEVDDCAEYPVSKEKLTELLETCKKVLADPSLAESLLPTQSGFFFGSTSYDEYYLKDLENTVEIIQDYLENPPELPLYYHSSW